MAHPLATLARAQAEWGAYWLRMALHHPDHAAACQHNAHMSALACLALEACA